MENIRDFINDKNVVKDEIYLAFENSVLCPICTDVLIEPTMCMNCQNVYCKKCINDWIKKSNKCPNRCENSNYQKSLAITELLSKLKFKCIYCGNSIDYNNIKNHNLLNCKRKGNIEKIEQNSNLDIKRNKINSK